MKKTRLNKMEAAISEAAESLYETASALGFKADAAFFKEAIKASVYAYENGQNFEVATVNDVPEHNSAGDMIIAAFGMWCEGDTKTAHEFIELAFGSDDMQVLSDAMKEANSQSAIGRQIAATIETDGFDIVEAADDVEEDDSEEEDSEDFEDEDSEDESGDGSEEDESEEESESDGFPDALTDEVETAPDTDVAPDDLEDYEETDPEANSDDEEVEDSEEEFDDASDGDEGFEDESDDSEETEEEFDDEFTDEESEEESDEESEEELEEEELEDEDEEVVDDDESEEEEDDENSEEASDEEDIQDINEIEEIDTKVVSPIKGKTVTMNPSEAKVRALRNMVSISGLPEARAEAAKIRMKG